MSLFVPGKTDPSSYAFSAYWLSYYDFETLNAVLRFSRILFDEEDTYDSSTGKYIVPVTGVYTFISQLCLGGDNYAAVHFVADGSRIGAFDIHNNSTCSSGTALAKLEKGRQFWLQVTDTALYCIYSRLSLSRSRRDPLKHFEVSVLRHIRCADLRKIPNEQPNFTNEHVI